MIGQKVSHYKIVERLGAGGMGEVYKARDTRLRRFVVLKALPSDETAERERRRRRFLREARTASALAHPGIVTIHDLLEHESGDFIVMEWIRGVPISALLESGELPWRQAVSYGIQIADAMAAAHDASVVHRDLKPQNVMVSDEARVKVLDFGIARLDGAETIDPLTLSGELTRDGMSLGTIAYMSPEQALGEPVDARSDIFSFGVMLYEMLSGRRPFTGPHLAAALHALHYQDPEPLLEIRPDLPPELATIVQRSLAKDPADRYPRMAEIAEELGALLSDEITVEAVESWPEVISLPESESSVSESWIRRAGLLAVAVMLAILIGSSDRVQGWWRGSPAAAVQSSTLDLDAGAAPFLLYREGQQALKRYDRKGAIDQAISALERALGMDESSAVTHALLGRAYWRKYRVENRDPLLLDRALDHASQALELDDHLTAAHVTTALIRNQRGETDQARDHVEQALILEPTRVDAHIARGAIHRSQGLLDAAEEDYRKAVELAPEDREALDSLGTLLLRRGRYEEAEALFLRSLESAPDSYISHRNLAAAYQWQGRYDEASEALQRSLELRPTASAYGNLGTLQFSLGRYRGSLTAFSKAIELGANDYRAWANLADAYRWTPGHRDQAEGTYRRAIQLVREGLEAAPDDPVLNSRLALYLAKSGEPESARQVIEEISADKPDDVTLLARKLVVHELIGDRERALELLSGVLEGGYPLDDLARDPELTELRRDPRYHRLIATRDLSERRDR